MGTQPPWDLHLVFIPQKGIYLFLLIATGRHFSPRVPCIQKASLGELRPEPLHPREDSLSSQITVAGRLTAPRPSVLQHGDNLHRI